MKQVNTNPTPASELPRKTNAGALKKDAVGLFDVVFMAVATAAPIAAMTGNFPYIVGGGNGIHAPAAFLFATLVLTVFSVGYVAMSKHITAAGAFYGYISYGLGQTAGMVSGLLATLAYVVFEAALVFLFASFVEDFAERHLSLHIHWAWPALFMVGANAALTYFHIGFAARVLGVFLILEVLVLLAGSLGTLFSGGGPNGIPLEPLRLSGAFMGENPGFGLFLAFWSWVGFESTAMYAEEARNPKKVIAQATLISVVGVGLFYTFTSWMLICEHGYAESLILGKSAIASDIVFLQLKNHYGHGMVILCQSLAITGAFACGLAFHNCASRYLYVLGRDGLIAGADRTLGRTHPVHGSPYVASFLQSIVVLVFIFYAFISRSETPFDMFVLIAILGTLAILIVQATCSVAVIAYFTRVRPDHFHWFQTFIAPLIGAVAMSYVICLLFQHKDAAVGETLAHSEFFKFTPYFVGLVAFSGLVIALGLKRFAPERYRLLGRIVMEDVVERELS
jgi:amino acid transporter